MSGEGNGGSVVESKGVDTCGVVVDVFNVGGGDCRRLALDCQTQLNFGSRRQIANSSS